MKWNKRNWMPVLALVAGLVVIGGCDSDTVAPQDDLPALTKDDVARQGGNVALGMVQLAQVAVKDPTTLKTAERYPVSGAGFTGTVWLDFRVAEGGADAPWQTAGWVHAYTTDDPLTYTTPVGGTTVFTFDYAAVLTRSPTAGVINGGGGMVSGLYSLIYTITDLEIQAGDDYPRGGTVDVASQGHTVSIAFNGTENAALVVDGTEHYTVNLRTGAVS